MALGQQQELEPESLEQQLKSNEACGYERGTTGVLSQAIEGARLRKWEISQERFNLVCRALQIPCDDGCNRPDFASYVYVRVVFWGEVPCVLGDVRTANF